jgi:hypothetical protein
MHKAHYTGAGVRASALFLFHLAMGTSSESQASGDFDRYPALHKASIDCGSTVLNFITVFNMS